MASRKQNEAVAGLLRRSLAGGVAAEPCPDPELVGAYFEHSLDDGETSRFEGHLSRCSRCREQLATMVRAESPKVQPKNFWLLDWRLLSVAGVAMVLVTVWIARRPSPLGPIPQTQSAPLVAMSKEAPKEATSSDYSSAVPPVSPTAHSARADAALRQTKPALVAPPAEPLSASSAADRIEEKKALDADTVAKSKQASSGANTLANKQVQTRPAESAVLGGTAGGVGSSPGSQDAQAQNTRSARAMPAPQQLQQQQQQQQQQPPIPASSQMVRVEPSAPPAARPAQKANAAAADIGARSETVEVTSAAQSTPATDDKHPVQPVISAYAANKDESGLQTIEARAEEKVIDTPIPSTKWRITSAGFVERSEDGGATWTGQEPDPDAHLIDGSAPTDKVCWLVGKQGIVLVTKDAATWKRIPPPADADITSVSAKSASAATVTTADGRKFTTHNEGKKWKPVE